MMLFSEYGPRRGLAWHSANEHSCARKCRRRLIGSSFTQRLRYGAMNAAGLVGGVITRGAGSLGEIVKDPALRRKGIRKLTRCGAELYCGYRNADFELQHFSGIGPPIRADPSPKRRKWHPHSISCSRLHLDSSPSHPTAVASTADTARLERPSPASPPCPPAGPRRCSRLSPASKSASMRSECRPRWRR